MLHTHFTEIGGQIRSCKLFKPLLIVSAILVLGCIFCSALFSIAASVFPDRGDWVYPLPNEFNVVKINSKNIVVKGDEYITQNGVHTSIYVDTFVCAFCYGERYIGCIQSPGEDQGRQFYIVDSEDHAVYGPFSEIEYNNLLISMDINDLCDWIDTTCLTADNIPMVPSDGEQVSASELMWSAGAGVAAGFVGGSGVDAGSKGAIIDVSNNVISNSNSAKKWQCIPLRIPL